MRNLTDLLVGIALVFLSMPSAGQVYPFFPPPGTAYSNTAGATSMQIGPVSSAGNATTLQVGGATGTSGNAQLILDGDGFAHGPLVTTAQTVSGNSQDLSLASGWQSPAYSGCTMPTTPFNNYADVLDLQAATGNVTLFACVPTAWQIQEEINTSGAAANFILTNKAGNSAFWIETRDNASGQCADGGAVIGPYPLAPSGACVVFDSGPYPLVFGLGAGTTTWGVFAPTSDFLSVGTTPLKYLTAVNTAGSVATVLGDSTSAASVTVINSGPVAGGPTFTIASGCATTSALTGGAAAGSFATTTTGTCTAVINLPPAPHGWSCHANNITHPVTFTQTASSTNTCTVSGATTSGDTVNFLAMGF